MGMTLTFPWLKSLLHHCAKSRSLLRGSAIHSALIKMGLSSDVLVLNHLLNMYAKCGQLKDGRKVFDMMSERNLVSWSAMISGCNQAGKLSTALLLFSDMDVLPNEHVYGSVLSACAGLTLVSTGEQVHAQVLKNGYITVSFVANSLMSMYMKCGFFHAAFSLFVDMDEVSSVSYNAMITGFAENGMVDKCLELFVLMNKQGLQPDMFSFSAVLGIITGMEDLYFGLELHCQALKLGLDITAFVGNVFITLYSKSHNISEARKVFRNIKEKDFISFNTYMASCSHYGDHTEALRAYREMEHDFGLIHDDFTLATTLGACSGLLSIKYGSQIHARVIRTKTEIDTAVGNALMNMYAKCGSIRHASSVFHYMSKRNLVSWNTIITALGNHGDGIVAVEAFERMVLTGSVPDSVTFIGLLTACRHSGLLEEGLYYFNNMKKVYKIDPQIEHLSCMIDLFGRAGLLEEAEDYVNSSAHQNDVIVWGSMLSSCRLHNNAMVGERAARKLLELQPVISSPYVLTANLYASSERWQGVAEARKMLKCNKVKKDPGWSSIEVNSVMEKFTVSDFSHPRTGEIKMALSCLDWEIRNLSSR